MSESMQEMPKVRIVYHPTFEQSYEVLRISGNIPHAPRWGNLFFGIQLAVAGILILQTAHPILAFVYFGSAFDLLWAFLFWHHRFQKRLRSYWVADPSAGMETVARLGTTGISIESIDTSSAFKWTAFTDLVETPRYFILKNGRTPVALPKNAMEDNQHDVVRAVLKENILNRVRGQTRAFPVATNGQ